MKKLLTITLLAIFIFASCQNEKNENENETESSKEMTSSFDSTALKTTTIDTDEDRPFLFRYKFVAGETFKYRLTTIAKSEQTIVADTTMSEKMSQTIIFIMNFKTVICASVLLFAFAKSFANPFSLNTTSTQLLKSFFSSLA